MANDMERSLGRWAAFAVGALVSVIVFVLLEAVFLEMLALSPLFGLTLLTATALVLGTAFIAVARDMGDGLGEVFTWSVGTVHVEIAAINFVAVVLLSMFESVSVLGLTGVFIIAFLVAGATRVLSVETVKDLVPKRGRL